MTDRPKVVVFDVNETLSDMRPMAQRFGEVGLPEHLAPTWFASVLRDGFGLTAAGAPKTFREIAAGVLGPMLTTAGIDDVEGATATVLGGFMALELHPDVAEGLRALRASGLRLVALTNGSANIPQSLFERSGVIDEFEALLTVDDAGAWKPARAAYDYAARQCGVETGEMVMVACHPWDLDGAARAGLRTAYVDRHDGAPYPAHLTAPDLSVAGIDELARALGA